MIQGNANLAAKPDKNPKQIKDFFFKYFFFNDRCNHPVKDFSWLSRKKQPETHKDLDFDSAVCSLTPQHDAHRGAWLRCGKHTEELDLAVGHTTQSQTSWNMSVFRVFVFLTPFDLIFWKTSEVKKIP